ncbi:MAG: pentapeptide MXKDX repeat protein [Devosia sp.]
MRTSTIALTAAMLFAAALPAFAQDAMKADPMAPDAMSSDAMAPDAMAGDAMAPDAMAPDAMAGGMMMDDMQMANDAMMAGDAMMGDAMMMDGAKLVKITIENVSKTQPFSPSFFESRAADGAPLFKQGDKASDALAAVAEGGNIGMFSVGAAKDMGATLGDAQLAIHTLPGQIRTINVWVDAKHPLIDGVWMLGNTNDGFSGVSGIDAFSLTTATTIEVLGYDAGSENNNEKKGFLGALGGGNERDLENGVITIHTGIRGDADAPKDWNWDVSKPVAKVTITPIDMGKM